MPSSEAFPTGAFRLRRRDRDHVRTSVVLSAAAAMRREQQAAAQQDQHEPHGHLKNSADLERDYLREVLEMLQTRLSNELNIFVRKITGYGTIAIFWTVVAGVYGMNFATCPSSDGPTAIPRRSG